MLLLQCPMADFFSGSRTDYTVEISNGTDNKEYFFATAVKMTGWHQLFLFHC